jgi:SNF2 family DNA or RNA helicase
MNVSSIESVTHPENWNVSLYPHQLASISNMEFFERERGVFRSESSNIFTKAAILADITGYGKTLSVLGLISRDRMKWASGVCEMKDVEGTRDVYIERISFLKPMETTVIVVPVTLVDHWRSECLKTDLVPLVIENKRHCEEINAENHRVIICNCNFFQTLLATNKTRAWKRIVFDEPHTMMNLPIDTLPCNFLWLVTATPMEIFKKLRRSLFGNTIPENIEIFQKIIVKNNDDIVRESFSMPNVFHQYYNSFHPVSYIVRGIVSPAVQEMIDAGNIKGALYALGYSRKDEKNLYEVIQDRYQKKINLLKAQMELADSSSERDRLSEKISVQSVRLEEMISRTRECLRSDCPVCMQSMSEPIMSMCCQNIICAGCCVKWTSTGNGNCPFCRQHMVTKNLVVVDGESSSKVTFRNRTQIVLDILEKIGEAGRVIIYSNHDESFAGLKEVLNERGVTWNDLKGKRETRDRSLTSFREGSTRVLILNSQVNSSGFNLPETTDVIFYHKIPETVELQVLGRALRIGRKIVLNIHHIN